MWPHLLIHKKARNIVDEDFLCRNTSKGSAKGEDLQMKMFVAKIKAVLRYIAIAMQ